MKTGSTQHSKACGAKHSKAKWSEIPMLAKVQKWGGPGSIMTKTFLGDITVSFWSRTAWTRGAMGTTKRVDVTGINRLAVRLQKLHFTKSLLSKWSWDLVHGAKHSKAKWCKIAMLAKVVRSTLKLNGPKFLCWQKYNNGGSKIDNGINVVFGFNSKL